MTPHLEFRTNITLDVQMTYSFLSSDRGAGGANFTKTILDNNPGLAGIDTDDYNALNDYFQQQYKDKRVQVSAALKSAKTKWQKVESRFISKIIGIFNGHEFPPGDYICYLSINDCNPRFLDSKTFQMYYLTNSINGTVAHELTHFLFYDYTRKRWPKVFGGMNPNKGIYWDLAELFNNVVLSLPEFTSLLGTNGDKPYPKHNQYYTQLRGLWEESKDIDKFILDGLDYFNGKPTYK